MTVSVPPGFPVLLDNGSAAWSELGTLVLESQIIGGATVVNLYLESLPSSGLKPLVQKLLLASLIN